MNWWPVMAARGWFSPDIVWKITSFWRRKRVLTIEITIPVKLPERIFRQELAKKNSFFSRGFVFDVRFCHLTTLPTRTEKKFAIIFASVVCSSPGDEQDSYLHDVLLISDGWMAQLINKFCQMLDGLWYWKFADFFDRIWSITTICFSLYKTSKWIELKIKSGL